MWKNFLDGDEEGGSQDNLLDDYEGNCSLSPMQVISLFLPSNYSLSLSKLSIHSFIHFIEQRVYGFGACLLAGFLCMILV